MRCRTRLVALAAAVAAVGGCNDSPRIGDEEYIANTVETLLKECGHESGDAVYDLLAQDTRRMFLQAGGVLEGCQVVTGIGDPQEIPAPDAFFRAQVERVQRRGDQATVVIRAGERDVQVHLLDTGMEWFVSNPPVYEPVGVDDLP